jgi:hypothetical protein
VLEEKESRRKMSKEKYIQGESATRPPLFTKTNYYF